MARIHVENESSEPEFGDSGEEEGETSSRTRGRKRRSGSTHVDVEIEREVTKRRLIESLTSILVVILYMAFTLLREREAGVVVLDDEADGLGPEDDWAE